MAGPLKTVIIVGGLGTFALAILIGIIAIIVTLASLKTLGPEDQLVVHYLDGRVVYNGPMTKVFNPFRDKTWRKKMRVGNLEYVRIKNILNGTVRVVEGAGTEWLMAYEEAEDKKRKIVLKQDQYIILVDRSTGIERVVKGPLSVSPNPWEEDVSGVKTASYINAETAIIVKNKATGTVRLHSTQGIFVPRAYEMVVENRNRIRVLPHETIVVRNAFGAYVIHSGAGEDGTGSGHSFFLGAFDSIVEFDWSSFSEPTEGGQQNLGRQKITRIDSRARKLFFQYDVRTNDNVAMRVEGAIFWQVTNVTALLEVTADPVSDVWYKARAVLISTVSEIDLETFMQSFNTRIESAYTNQANESFYSDRGIEVQSMEVTKYECTDAETAAVLQEIIQETTQRINALQQQKSENDVKEAKLNADIELERKRTQLIQTKSTNERITAALEGEAEGVQLATAATTFLDHLNESVPSLSSRLGLYKMHNSLKNQNERTAAVANSKATMFMTPETFDLNMKPEDLQKNDL